ncbi:MAG: mitomycin resistance protein [Phycisphaerales bacterium]|nr:mitomycin resistance protein [Phycisphaerales bacterium]
MVAKAPVANARPVEPSLADLRNVGPATVTDLSKLGIRSVRQLATQDAFELYERLCRITRQRHDPCVIDVFMSAIDQARGGKARPWWHYTPQRKRRMA